MNSNGNGAGARTGNTMMRDALLHALQQEVTFDGCIMSKMQAVARKLVAKALAGDMRAIKEVFDRIDGKARPAVVAREQPMEAQAGIGLAEQLRQLTADFPPPAAAGSDEQSTPSVDMPPRRRPATALPPRFQSAKRPLRLFRHRSSRGNFRLSRPPTWRGQAGWQRTFWPNEPTGKPSSHTGCSPSNCRAVRSREELPR